MVRAAFAMAINAVGTNDYSVSSALSWATSYEALVTCLKGEAEERKVDFAMSLDDSVSRRALQEGVTGECPNRGKYAVPEVLRYQDAES